VEEREKQLIETRRAEAIALFQAGQAQRAAADRVIALFFTAVGIAVAAGVNAHNEVTAIVLAPLVVLFLSYAFQQYADVSVLGAAREALERDLSLDLAGRGLIYETEVAPIRKRRPLLVSMRVMQGASALLILAVVAVAAVVAFRDRPWYVEAGFVAGTVVALVSAVLSYRDMLRSGHIARAELGVARPGVRERPRGTLDSGGYRDRVFISYRQGDDDIAHAIAQRLAGAGSKVWLDKLEVGEGAHAIHEALDSARAFVLVIGSAPSTSLLWEWSGIAQRLWADPQTPVVPVLIGDAQPPGFLRDRAAIHLRPGELSGLDDLMRVLEEPTTTNADDAAGRRAVRLEEIRESAREATRAANRDAL
jgi:hypothetical protein